MSIPRSMHRSITLGFAAALALSFGCTSQGSEDPAFRGDEHETDKPKADTGDHDTGAMETGQAETGGETGGEEMCVRTQGYWRNHSIYASQSQNNIPWPISEDTTLCGATWFQWLGTPPQGDAWIILVHQYIAASLNQAAGADVPDDVQTALDDATALLAGCSISDDDRDGAIELSETLDAYNNGEMGVASCDDQDSIRD